MHCRSWLQLLLITGGNSFCMCNAQLGSPHNHNHKTSNRSVHVQSTVHVLWRSCTWNTQQKTNLLLTETDSLSCFHPPHSAAVQAVVEDHQTRLTRAIHMQNQCEYSMQLIQLRIQNLSKVSQISDELIVRYRYIAESITTDAGRFGCIGLCQLCTKQSKTTYKVLYAVDKGLCSWNALHQLLLILLHTYLLTISLPDIDKVAVSLYDIVRISNTQYMHSMNSREQNTTNLPWW